MAHQTLEDLKQMADQLPPEDQLNLIEYVAHNLWQTPKVSDAQTGEGSQSQSLRGIWRERFPEDFDIDSALYEIRHEWEKECDEVAEE